MATLGQLVRAGRTLRAIGVDDAPFQRGDPAPVPVSGVVCQGTRFEGLLWDRVTQDGDDGTAVLTAMIAGSKFARQAHVVLTDGITLGGLNVVDLAALSDRLGCPCISVMRRRPDLAAMRRALQRVRDPDRRWAMIQRAGPVHERNGFTFQVVGASLEDAAVALGSLTDRGQVPEPLRLAHLIGSAVITGQSGKRA
jgi:endonuclease V-like protein UPF0215 family